MTRALIAIDYNDDVDLIIETCREWTAKSLSQLIILGIAPDLKELGSFKRLANEAQRTQAALLEDLRARVGRVAASFGSLAEPHMTCGKVSDEIIKAVILHGADFVLKAVDVDHSGQRLGFGQVAKTLIRKCPVPVWIASPESKHPPERICVAVDNIEKASDASEATLLALSLIGQAADLAHRLNIKEITLLHAWSAASTAFLRGPRAQVNPDDIAHYMDECERASLRALDTVAELAQAQLSHVNVRLHKELVMGPPAVAIAQATAELGTDILVIGSANRSGIMGLLVGNTAEAILGRVDCSIFVVKPEGLSALIAAHVSPPLSQTG